jgi:hypothetical protein
MDWNWATATGGALTGEQRRQLLSPLTRIVVGYLRGRVKLMLGLRGKGGVNIDALRWPDSRLAKDAETEARDVLSPDLLAHSYRSYLFGLALAGLDAAPVDEELCYVSCLLHDLKLSSPTPARCFAVVGGEQAQRFALDRGVAAGRAASIGAAVAGHITPGIADDLSDPAGFVSAGAFVDVAGVRLDELDPRWVTGLLERHPRYDFKRRFRGYWAAESAAVPAGRARWLTRYAGFPLLIRAAPFSE